MFNTKRDYKLIIWFRKQEFNVAIQYAITYSKNKLAFLIPTKWDMRTQKVGFVFAFCFKKWCLYIDTLFRSDDNYEHVAALTDLCRIRNSLVA